MAAPLFLEYPKCSTCRKARAWLEKNGIAYEDRHIVDEPPTADELRAWAGLGRIPVRKLFNTSGRLYRELGVSARLAAGMTDDEALGLLASNGMLVRRPLLVGEDFAFPGFKEDQWKEALL